MRRTRRGRRRRSSPLSSSRWPSGSIRRSDGPGSGCGRLRRRWRRAEVRAEAVRSVAGFRNGRNVRAVAEIKLQVFGLDRHIRWEVGAYGEEHDERADLVALALERAGVPAADTVLIGDTPADVAAGLQQGVRVLAVASGHSSEDVLRQAGADVVLSSLEDPRLLVKLVRGHDVEA